MKSINCEHIRGEIEESGSADFLSQAALAHISGCADCETLSREHNRLHAMLANLGTIEAPGDFDFKLRARLAAEKSGRGSSFPFLSFSFGARAAAVATVLLAVFAALAYVNFRTPANTGVAGTQQQKNVFAAGEPRAEVAGIVSAPQPVDRQLPGNEARPVNQTPVNRGANGSFVASSGSRKSTDVALSPARVIRADQLAASTPFPINASLRSHTVSVADGRGGSRTISLPSVSFGNEGGLSQNTVASSRGTW